VSRLFPERLRIGLAPAEISLDGKRLACDPALGTEPWQGAVQALKSQSLRAADATVVLSNHFVRYALVPWSDALAGEAEEEAYLRHHFARIHGERAKSWLLRASEDSAGAPRLCSAIDGQLLEALKACFPKSGKARLVSVQPQLMAVFNRWRGAIPRSGAWLMVVEADRACAALHAKGRWHSVQNARGEWRVLLERERHRAAGTVPDLVLLHADPALPAEAPGWKVQRLPHEAAAA
jgi:hypothetical protein